ncbi:MAG: hypothetical protein H7Z20_07895 [Bdellovibrio sp.]|nr:hypothetical protein [Methylotenera sp.]
MKIEMTKAATLDDILNCYSGRRLQFAIKLGILPKPEQLSQVLTKKLKVKKPFSAFLRNRLSS